MNEGSKGTGLSGISLTRAAVAAVFLSVFGTAFAFSGTLEPPQRDRAGARQRDGASQGAGKSEGQARQSEGEGKGDGERSGKEDGKKSGKQAQERRMQQADLARLDSIAEPCWAELRNRRIYFAHQAIGSDIVRGLEEIARRRPSIGMTVVAYAEPDRSDGTVHSVFDDPAIVEGKSGRRGNPEQKIDEFERMLRGSEGSSIDVAVLKLCYGDIGRLTDVDALADRYFTAVEAIERDRPNIHLIHCTVPLKAEDEGFKGRMRKLVGAGSDASNTARLRYNERIRERFEADRIFDIARIEATRLDGTEATIERNGRKVQVLADEFTDNGAHLNPLGRETLAREFLMTLSHQCGAARVTAAGGGRGESPEQGSR